MQTEIPITYDANGNMTDDGGNRTFEWDAANRLVAVNYKDTGSRSEFVYDGLSRRVKILEYDGSSAATIEPGSGQYETFTAGPFTLPAGNYTLLFQGLNANGGANAMLLDDVTLDGASVTNGSFESPTVANYQYRPAGTAWTYGDSSGVAAAPGSVTGSVDVPDGVQSAFIAGNGALWQTFPLPSGTHSFNFQAAQAVSLNESSQQVRVTLLGLPTSTKTFVWSGNTLAEERDASGMNVTKRFFAEGEQRVGEGHVMNYYYSRDHLGSIREVTSASGVVKARYDYDAWGNQTVVTGNMSFDFGYTGHYRHAASNLYLAPYRAYDPGFARWLNRDPIAETGGINLYRYVGNNAVGRSDPLGLLDYHFAPGISDHVRSLANRAIARLDATPTGQWLRSLPGQVTIVDGKGGRAPQGGGDTVSLDPTDPLGVGANSDIQKLYRDELPPVQPGCTDSEDDFLAVIFAHEVGHAALDIDDPFNVLYIENPVRAELGMKVMRKTYHDGPLH